MLHCVQLIATTTCKRHNYDVGSLGRRCSKSSRYQWHTKRREHSRSAPVHIVSTRTRGNTIAPHRAMKRAASNTSFAINTTHQILSDSYAEALESCRQKRSPSRSALHDMYIFLVQTAVHPSRASIAVLRSHRARVWWRTHDARRTWADIAREPMARGALIGLVAQKLASLPRVAFADATGTLRV
jgi:hypothetical protein